MEQVHGHEVKHSFGEFPSSSTREEVIALVESKFGTECRFYNCSGENLTAKDLLAIFESKGKITFTDSGFELGSGGGCNH